MHKSIHHFYSPPIIYFGYQPISRLYCEISICSITVFKVKML
nr:MAG TPA: hypothetical protein [Caudoviricetes sp.]